MNIVLKPSQGKVFRSTERFRVLVAGLASAKLSWLSPSSARRRGEQPAWPGTSLPSTSI